MQRPVFDPPGLETENRIHTTHISCLENLSGQRRLMRYSPWSCKGQIWLSDLPTDQHCLECRCLWGSRYMILLLVGVAVIKGSWVTSPSWLVGEYLYHPTHYILRRYMGLPGLVQRVSLRNPPDEEIGQAKLIMLLAWLSVSASG